MIILAFFIALTFNTDINKDIQTENLNTVFNMQPCFEPENLMSTKHTLNEAELFECPPSDDGCYYTEIWDEFRQM